MAYLQSSGAISMSDINGVFGRGNNLNAYRGTTWYTAAGGSGTFSSGAISFSDFYSKGPSAAFTPSLAGLAAYNPLEAESFVSSTPCTAQIYFGSDGSWYFYGEGRGNTSGNWGTPTTTGVGAGYWIQWTRTYFSGGIGASATATSGWQQLSSSRYITVYNPGGLTVVTAQYNIYIATDSGGSNVVASVTGMEFDAFANPA